MRMQILAATAATILMAAPAIADEARTPPPTEPYYAPQTASCDTVSLRIYFESGGSELTPFARDSIREAREQLSGCAVTELAATAIAGEAGSDESNLTLAEARRDTIMQALTAHGIRSAKTDFRTVTSESGEALMARQVDIELKAEPALVG